MKTVLLAIALALPVSLTAKIITKPVEYRAGSVTLKGLLVYDDAVKGKRPGVIVVHEWWGLNNYPKDRAQMLAKLGYVAFAADMYGDGKTADTPADAQTLAGESMKDPNLLKSKFLAAREVLARDEHTDPNQIAAIGYCYGGGVVLNMARAGVDIKAVVSFHGSLGAVIPAEKGKVKAKILVCAGAADKFISAEDVKTFKNEMKSNDADMKYIDYEGALHAFSNPAATAIGKKYNMPIAYDEKADKQSWSDMQKFLKSVFKK